jgi:hypothetical protein
MLTENPKHLDTEPDEGANVDRKDLCRAVSEIADSHWHLKQMPVLLSALPDMLREKIGTDEYHKILGVTKIKSFIKSSGEEFGYKLIEHPTQRARIGVAPVSATYQFKVEADVRVVSREDAHAFVRGLGKLSEEDLRGISIPASLIVKLFGEK